MAQVPYADGVASTSPETQVPNDYQRVDTSPAMFGGSIAQGEQQLGAGASKMAQFYGQVAADDATNNYQESQNKILHGDPNGVQKDADGNPMMGPDGKPLPDGGFFALKGEQQMRARAGVEKQLDDLVTQQRQGLSTPDSQLLFDQYSRRIRSYATQQIGDSASKQVDVWADNVAQKQGEVALNSLASNFSDPVAVGTLTHDVIDSFVKRAQINRGGGYDENGNPDDVLKGAIAQGRQAALKTQLQAMGVQDPVGALKLADQHKDALGTEYAPVADALTPRANKALGYALATQSTNAAVSNPNPALTSGNQPTADQIHAAIINQESGGNPNAATSVNGAVGAGQVIPATFRQYAKPGEDINNPTDNVNVSRRIVDDLYNKFGGDPQRIAVGYFSGPGNVAPAGSPTPWINNAADGQGNTVAQYVAGIDRKMGVPPAALAQIPGVNSATALRADAYQRVMDSDVAPEVKQEAINHINQQYQTAMIAAGVNDKARKEADDGARNDILTKIGKGGTSDIVQQIYDNPSLTPESKSALLSFAEGHAASDPSVYSMVYGKGAADLYLKVTAPLGDPNKIVDPNVILRAGGPGGPLNARGVEMLTAAMQKEKGNPNEASLNQAKGLVLLGLKNRFSFEGQEAGISFKDPKGAALFNETIGPNFLTAYDQAVASGQDPHDFLKKSNIDQLFPDSLRPRSQMAMDKISEGYEQTGETPNQPAVPVPAPANGINQDNWNSTIKTTPLAENGQYWSQADWATALNRLYSDPSPERIKAFDKRFESGGFKAENILKQLKAPPESLTDRLASGLEGLAN